MRFSRFTCTLLLSAAVFPMTLAGIAQEGTPVGIYLWYSGASLPPTDAECKALIERLEPSGKKAEAMLWGRMPEEELGADEHYLILTADRMASTFSAEGDYDHGQISYARTENGTTRFLLSPDGRPDLQLSGVIVSEPGSSIVEVTLLDVPVDQGTRDRTTYYCRFEEPSIEI